MLTWSQQITNTDSLCVCRSGPARRSSWAAWQQAGRHQTYSGARRESSPSSSRGCPWPTSTWRETAASRYGQSILVPGLTVTVMFAGSRSRRTLVATPAMWSMMSELPCPPLRSWSATTTPTPLLILISTRWEVWEVWERSDKHPPLLYLLKLTTTTWRCETVRARWWNPIWTLLVFSQLSAQLSSVNWIVSPRSICWSFINSSSSMERYQGSLIKVQTWTFLLKRNINNSNPRFMIQRTKQVWRPANTKTPIQKFDFHFFFQHPQDH